MALRGLNVALSRLVRPIDGASVAVFRILFGLLMFAGLTRFMANGWIERFYGDPTFFFKYDGFSWVEPLSVGGMYAVYSLAAVAALMVAAGLFYRASVAVFLVAFTYAQLIDVTNYLNHYYLVGWLAVLLLIIPAHRMWSVDALRARDKHRNWTPAWALYLLRFQIGVVYVFAGLAKLGSDWLLHAQPLGIWLSARTETPVIGALLDEIWVAYLFSWAGFLFDTTIVLWLSWKKSRRWAYIAVLSFHLMTHVFFNIGLFPFIMVLGATIFFDPGWPRRLLRRNAPALPAASPALPSPQRLACLGVATAFIVFSIAVPLRHYLYPGDVSWNELGMRYSWKVMLREKHGAVTYIAVLPSGERLEVAPRRYLSARQEREMAGQPDLIAQLAEHIASDLEARGYGSANIYAEAMISWNGRPPHPLIDSNVALAGPDADLEGAWILPEPPDQPIRLAGAGPR